MLGARSGSERGRHSSIGPIFESNDSSLKSIDGCPEHLIIGLLLPGKSKHKIPQGALMTTRVARLLLLLLALLLLLLQPLPQLAHGPCMVSLPAECTEGPAGLAGMVVVAAEEARIVAPTAEPTATFTAETTADTTASATISATASTTTSTTIGSAETHSDTNTY